MNPRFSASLTARLLAGLVLVVIPVAAASAQPKADVTPRTDTAPKPEAVPTPPPAKASSTDDAPSDGTIVRRSLVKIFTTSREPSLAQPWVKSQPEESSGSGVVIDGKRIITNNHVIAYATRILVQPDGSSDKLTAKVVAAAPGIDLAIIELTGEQDQAFFDTHPPIAISDELPDVGRTVWAYGYPIGGDAVSITKGVISRIEHTSYNGFTSGLRIQIDAAINPGNSGGPAVMDGKLVGLAFSGISGADNVGYIIPIEEVRDFLSDIKDGAYQGNAQLFEEMQTVENESLRAKLGLTPQQTGLMVTKVDATEPTFPLKMWDVVSAIGDHDIDNTGQVTVRENLRLSFRYYIPRLAKEGKVPFTIIRDGKELKVDVPVRSEPNRLFKPLNGGYPRYFIVGPMCFSAVSADHVGAVGRAFLDRGSPLTKRRNDKPKFDGEELVVGPARLFSHPMMKGYEIPPLPVLKTVNGTPIKNLKHLVEVLRDATDPFIIFEWDDSAAETIVFKREDLLNSTDEILEEQQIRNQMSDDLKSVWNHKK